MLMLLLVLLLDNDDTMVTLGPSSGNVADWYINASYIHV